MFEVKGTETTGNMPLLKWNKDPFFYALLGTLISISMVIISLKIHKYVILTIFFILGIVLVWLTNYIKNNQCNACKRLFFSPILHETLDKTIERPYHFREETKYLYSNWNYHTSKFGEPQTVIERVQIWKKEYKCNYCNHNIYSKTEELNLDLSHRPDPVKIVKTSIKEPRECILCGKKLKSRRKYCSSCRPYGRSSPYELDE